MKSSVRGTPVALLGALALTLTMAVAANRPAPAAEREGGGKGVTVTPAFAYPLPNQPGETMTGVLVQYAPGGYSLPHHHTSDGSVVAYVLEGAIRSKVGDGPERVYRAGESWIEPPGAAHPVSENASSSEQARLLAVFVAKDGAKLTTFDR